MEEGKESEGSKRVWKNSVHDSDVHEEEPENMEDEYRHERV